MDPAIEFEPTSLPKDFGKGKTLLFVLNEIKFYLSHRANLGREALSHGFKVYLAAPETSDKAYLDREIEYIPLDLDRTGMNPLRELKTILMLSALYKKIKPDLVHHVTIKPILYGSIAARLSGVPAVVNAISGLGYAFISRGLLAEVRRMTIFSLYRLGLRHHNQVSIFQNGDDRELFIANRLLRSSQTTLIRGSGVDSNIFSPIDEPAGVPVVLMISRIIKDKGVREFVAAAKKLHSLEVKARFVIAGDPDPTNPAGIPIHEIQGWQDSKTIELLGQRTDILQIIKGSHIVCLPSYREGLPKALIEAAACGRPIVTTNTPGCREIVIDGYNGLLVPVADSDALADALAKLINSKPVRAQMGAASRELFLTGGFDEQTVNLKTMELYRQVLSIDA